MSRRTLESLVALNLARGVGPTLHRRLVETFGSIEAALGKSEATLQKVKGIGPVVSRNILAAADPKKVQAEFDLAEKLGCRVLAFMDPDFPEVCPLTVHAIAAFAQSVSWTIRQDLPAF